MFGILCFGDSISFGRGENPCIGWVGRLKDYHERLGFHNGVYNLGVPGHTSADLLQRFDIEAQARLRLRWPDDKYVILIAIGTNDCKWDGMPEENTPRCTLEDFEKNIQELIAKSKTKKAQTIFIGLTPVDESKTLPFEKTAFKNERVKQFNDIIEKKCEESNIPFIDIFNPVSEEDYPLLLEDGLHPNKKGYDKMFEIIKNFLVESKHIE